MGEYDPAATEVCVDGVSEAVVRSRAQSYFEGVSPCHDWQHVQRVVALAKRLADATDADLDRGVLIGAGWLHDIGRTKEARGAVDDHAVWGSNEARHILAEMGVDDTHRDAIAHCIRAHRYSNDVVPATIEAKLLADADNLDATGAVGVARVFAYAGEYGNTLYDPEQPPDTDDSAAGATAFNHFHEKILDLTDRMYTDAGHTVAADRQAYVESFLDRFEREAHGEDV